MGKDLSSLRARWKVDSEGLECGAPQEILSIARSTYIFIIDRTTYVIDLGSIAFSQSIGGGGG